MKSRNGFTLFELLISISIIGILTALAVVSYSGSQVRARNARRIEDMNMIQKAAEQYYAANGYSYPNGTAAFYSGSSPVLVSWPLDPKNSGSYTYSYRVDVPVVGSFCACALTEPVNSVKQGNSTVNCGDFTRAPGTTDYYCVKGQQQ